MDVVGGWVVSGALLLLTLSYIVHTREILLIILISLRWLSCLWIDRVRLSCHGLVFCV